MRGNEFLQSDEDRLTAGKLIDAANMCYKRDIPVTTDFSILISSRYFTGLIHHLSGRLFIMLWMADMTPPNVK